MTKSREQYIKDLEWFFWECDSAMGISSTYSAFIAACKFSTKHQDEVDLVAFTEMCQNTTTAYDVLAATRKNRRILGNYQQLSAKHKMVLEAYYDERQYESEEAKSFGKGIGLVPYTSIGETFNRLLLLEPGKNFAQQFKAAKNQLRKEVDQLINEAVDAYVEIAKAGETK